MVMLKVHHGLTIFSKKYSKITMKGGGKGWGGVSMIVDNI